MAHPLPPCHNMPKSELVDAIDHCPIPVPDVSGGHPGTAHGQMLQPHPAFVAPSPALVLSPHPTAGYPTNGSQIHVQTLGINLFEDGVGFGEFDPLVAAADGAAVAAATPRQLIPPWPSPLSGQFCGHNLEALAICVRARCP